MKLADSTNNRRQKRTFRPDPISEYQPWMPSALQEHVDAGMSVLSFRGKHNISVRKWYQLIKDNPELRIINERYKMRKKR